MDKYSKKIDLGIILFIIAMFCIINFFALVSKDNFFENEFMLVAVMATVIIVYFYGITAGIILSTIIIFIYGSYTIYNTLILGKDVSLGVYFWIVMVIYICIDSALIRNNIYNMENDLKKLNKEYSEFVTVDSVTKLDNTRAFYNELSQCMSMSKRYKIPLCLMIIKINHFDEMAKIIGTNQMSNVLKYVSENIINSSRHEDRLFALDKRDTFAMIMWTSKDNTEVIRQRIKDNVNNINLKTFSKGINVIIDLKLGIAQYMPPNQDIMELVKEAKKEIEYDV